MASCSSTNAVVRNAVEAVAGNAAPVKDGRYEVELVTVTFNGRTTLTKTMTDAQLKTWLGQIRSGWMHGDALKQFEKGWKNYGKEIDMQPFVWIRQA